jgi:hypothetical protein
VNVINKDREVHAAQDLEQKIDLLSQYISALAALALVVISVGEIDYYLRQELSVICLRRALRKKLLNTPSGSGNDHLI